jgi:hypothetical protein
LPLKGKESTSKFREKGDEIPVIKNLLLLMVRLIHADPMLMLNVSIHDTYNMKIKMSGESAEIKRRPENSVNCYFIFFSVLLCVIPYQLNTYSEQKFYEYL